MELSNPNLNTLRVTFERRYERGLSMAATMRDRVATIVPSSTGENLYGWLGEVPNMVEWIGPRTISNLIEKDYRIPNKDFEATVRVNRNHIEDDNLGQYAMRFEMMGKATASHPEQLVWGGLKAGFSTNCYDGQFFFDTDHPVLLADGSMGTFANTDGGSGTPWFLMCTNEPIKPMIFQDRKKPKFVALDRPEDTNLFMNKEIIYGVDARYNVGYGFPQMAWGSKQTLNATNYEAARAAIASMKGDYGRPLGLIPNMLVVPTTLEGPARRLLNSEFGTGGISNEWKGTAELLLVPWL